MLCIDASIAASSGAFASALVFLVVSALASEMLLATTAAIAAALLELGSTLLHVFDGLFQELCFLFSLDEIECELRFLHGHLKFKIKFVKLDSS